MNTSKVKNMTAKTTVCAAAAVLAGVISSASAGEFYDNETTNTMFTVNASAVDLTESVWGGTPTNGSATVQSASDAIVLDTDLDDPLVYTPGGTSGEIAVVKAHVVVSPNATVPEAITDAQAALTTVTNNSGYLEWYGLVGGNSGAEWIALTGDTPVTDEAYDIIITLDNRAGQKTIRYSVKGPGDADYTHLTYETTEWLNNPKNNKSGITAIAFSGVGQFGDFSADSVVNDAVSIEYVGEVAGFDFKGGSVTALVSAASGSFAGKTATLSIVDFADGSTKTFDAVSVPNDGNLSWDLSDKITTLTPGGTYSYTVSISGGPSASGTFTAANWNADGDWFRAAVGDIYNGTWSETPEITNSNQYAIYGDTSFNVTDSNPGMGVVSRVDTKYTFETFVSADALQALDDAVSGIVAATNGSGAAWYAYTGNATWSPLDAITPAVNAEYILRAEFDFKSSTKRVRYQVSTDNGASFTPMTLSGNQWIDLTAAGQAKTSLSAVSISGKGVLTSIRATVSDSSVAAAGGNHYATLWDAIESNSGAVTLLTNATLTPSGIGRRIFQITDIGFEMKYNEAASAGWSLFKKGDYWYLMKIGGTYLFK